MSLLIDHTYIAGSVVLHQRVELFAQRCHCGVRGCQILVYRIAKDSPRGQVRFEMEEIRKESESCSSHRSNCRSSQAHARWSGYRTATSSVLPEDNLVAYFAPGRFRNGVPFLQLQDVLEFLKYWRLPVMSQNIKANNTALNSFPSASDN